MRTTLSHAGFTAVIDHRGAELVSLIDDTGREFMWEGNPAYWGKHSPVLFPIVGTLKNNSYRYAGKTHRLSRHGFARDREFALIDRNDHQATFALRSDDETLVGYPFHFELQLTYSLSNGKLTIDYKVFNLNDVVMPFSLGAHPALALPENFEDYAIVFEHDDAPVSYLLENDLISDNTMTLALADRVLPLSYELFANDALVFKKLKSQKLTITKDGKPLLTVDYHGFPNLGLWTKPEAPFLCIEPWFGYADTVDASGELLEKEAMIHLSERGNFETKFSILML